MPQRPYDERLLRQTFDVALRARTAGEHPFGSLLADKDGNVWEAAVDSAAELVEMVETARQYQNNVQVLETAKGLINETLRLGQ